MKFPVMTSAKAEVMRSVLSVWRIIAKVMSRFHWNLVLWLRPAVRRTD